MGKLIGMLNLDQDSSNWPSWHEANSAFQREYLEQVLSAANGNQSLAAHLLGVHRNTLGRLCIQLGIDFKSMRNKKRLVYRMAPPRSKMTSEQLESRKQQDEIVRRKLAVAPLRFEANGKEMMYCYPDSKHDLAGWILYRHPDGQWVTLRKATDQDISAMSRAVSKQFHDGYGS